MTTADPMIAVVPICSPQKMATGIGLNTGSMHRSREASTESIFLIPMENRILGIPYWKTARIRSQKIFLKSKTSVSVNRKGRQTRKEIPLLISVQSWVSHSDGSSG